MSVAVLSVVLLACGEPSSSASSLTAEAVVSEAIPTVATVTFEGPGEGTVWVEWGTAPESLNHKSMKATSAGPAHEVLVGGMPPLTKVFVRAVHEVDGVQQASELLELQTGAASTDLPNFDVSVSTGPTAAYVLTTTVGVPSSAFIVDRDGAPVWWFTPGSQYVVNQAHVSPSGTEVWVNRANRDFGIDSGAVFRVRLDGTIMQEITTPLAHHDFVVLPDDEGIAYLTLDVRDVGGDSVIGDAIMEIATDGSARTVWSAFDDFDPGDVDPSENTGFYPQGYDWTHGNGMSYDPDTDSYLVSLRNLSSIVSVDRASGRVNWVVGGAGDMRGVDLTRGFFEQHSPRLTPDGKLLVFDNGAPYQTGAYSRAIELAVDPAAGTYTQVWAFDDQRDNVTYLLGDAQRLPSGNTLVSWGNVGMLTEVDPSGEVVWRLNSDIGHGIGFHTGLSALGGVP
jgi:hypothetical protein